MQQSNEHQLTSRVSNIRLQDPEAIAIADKHQQLSRLERLVHKIFAVAFFIYTYDPYLIYKRKFAGHELAKYRFYQSKDVALEWDTIDRMRDVWRRCLQFWLLYTGIKFGILGCLHLILLQRVGVTRANRLEQHLVVDVIKLIGDPLEAKSESAVFVYLGAGSIVFYSIFYQPLTFLRVPMNNNVARFYLDPMRELRRVDNQSVDSIYRILYSGRKGQMTELKRQKLLHDLIARLWLLRPPSYSYCWLIRMNNIMSLMFTTLPSINTIFILVVLSSVLDSSMEVRLREMSSQADGFWQRISVAMDGGQLLTLSEILVYALIIAMFTSATTVGAIAYTMSLRHTVAGIRHDLKSAISRLVLANGCLERRRLFELDYELQLVEAMVRVRASILDLQVSTEFLSELFSINSVSVLVAFPLVNLLASYEGSVISRLKPHIVGFIWIWVHLTGIGCAHIYAITCNLEKLACSLLAQLIARSALEKRYIVHDAIGSSWLKFIMSRMFSSAKSSVRPFGYGLTFRRLLKINFLALSFVSIVRNI